MFGVRRGCVSCRVSVLCALLALTACYDPFAVTDKAERDLDRPLPGVGDVEGPEEADYDTRPTWYWTGCEAEGTQLFRYRINGGDWVILVDLEAEPDGRYRFCPGDEDRDLYPGTYLFEVQERNTAGNWSEASSQTTLILVQPPVITGGPVDPTNNPSPSFTWNTVEPPQYGNGETGLYSWRLVRQEGAEWVTVPAHSAEDQAATDYSITGELADGTYRFGTAERNAGGERSAFFVAPGAGTGDYIQFRVDTVPPDPPMISSTSLQGPVGDRYVTESSPVFTWTSGGPDGVGEWEHRISGLGYSGAIVPGTESIVELVGLEIGQSYTLEVRERDAAMNWSEWASVTFSVRTLGTILIENPESPTLSIGGVPVVRQPETEVFTVVAGDGIVIDSYIWSINGVPSEDVAGATVGGDPPGSALVIDSDSFTIGGYTLTLVVVINGVPYSEQFGFVIVDE